MDSPRRRVLHIPPQAAHHTLPHQLANVLEQQDPGPRSVSELSTDEQYTAHLHRRNFGTHSGITTFGKITYAMPYVHWYRVQLDDAAADFPCCQVTDCAATPFSVRSSGPLTPGCSVLVYKPAEGFYGFILGVVPDIVGDGALVHPDWISQGSNMGFKRELYYHGVMSLFANQGSVLDFSNGRPVDSSSLGEWGKMSDLGGGIHIDPFHVFLRINETCGLFLHYLDDLTRLEGSNLDIRTAVSELVSRNDSGEGMHYSGFSPYSWEATGALAPFATIHREIDDKAVQYTQPYGKFEPLYDDQQPFYRSEEYRGYLGQAWLRQVMLPPQNNSSTEVLQYSSELVLPGVFREHVGLDGSYGMQSAHSIVLAKRGLIPIGKRIQPVESPAGDDIDTEGGNYRFAGVFTGDSGGAEQHKVGDVDPGEDRANLIRAAGLSDYLAHLFNWKSLHPFHYHAKDFYLPEHSEMEPVTTLQRVPLFSSLLQQTWLDASSPVAMTVDHRYGSVDYYEVESSFSLLPDGSSVWRGGNGEEIRFLGGSIQISCPGDILMQPGRSLVAYGGDDIVLKANKSIDITANENDVRLKAERNVGIMGGNGGSGRVLIESKAEGFLHDYDRKIGEDINGSGILLKAANSQIAGWGSEIYLRTGGGDVTPGPIVFDADQGTQDIRTVSRGFIRHINLVAADYFPSGEGKTVANTFSALNSQFQTSCQFDGGLFVTRNGMFIRGNLAILGGHIGTENAQDYNFYVGWLHGQSLGQSKAALEEVLQGMETVREGGNDDYSLGIDERYYDDGQVGNDDVIRSTAFSLRNEEQYNTEDWEFPETYWQQMARESQQELGTWEDNPVEYQNSQQVLSPHPGYDRWRAESWLTLDLTMHDHATGQDEPRSEGAYLDPTFGEWKKLIPDENYPVISQ